MSKPLVSIVMAATPTWKSCASGKLSMIRIPYEMDVTRASFARSHRRLRAQGCASRIRVIIARGGARIWQCNRGAHTLPVIGVPSLHVLARHGSCSRLCRCGGIHRDRCIGKPGATNAGSRGTNSWRGGRVDREKTGRYKEKLAKGVEEKSKNSSGRSEVGEQILTSFGMTSRGKDNGRVKRQAQYSNGWQAAKHVPRGLELQAFQVSETLRPDLCVQRKVNCGFEESELVSGIEAAPS